MVFRTFSIVGWRRRALGFFALVIWLTGLQGDLTIERLLEDQAVRLVIKGERDDTWSVAFSDDLELWQGLGEAGLVVLDATGRGELVITPTSDAQFYRATLSEKANSLPAPYNPFSEELTLNIVDGEFMVIESSNVPNHPSPYFSQGDDRYEAYDGANASFRLNPNSIGSHRFVYRIPLNLTGSFNKRSTNLGSIGIGINGVALFNLYGGSNQSLTNERDSFDQFNGHPQNTGVYHYYIEPLYLTSMEAEDGLVGELFDGFLVYGPIENGVAVSNADLDEYRGHFHATEEFPEGIYHYHFTDTDPYLNRGEYFGNPSTQTN